MAKNPRRQSQTSAVASTLSSDKSISHVFVPLFIAAAAVLLYATSWSHGFVGDDSWVTWNNAWVKEGLGALPRIVSHSLYFGAVPKNSDLYRPVAGAYFTILGAIVNHGAVGYHVANTLLYGLNVAALFVFFAAIGDRRSTNGHHGLALVATVLFVVHPIHTEVVDNIKSADEMLCLFFVVCSAVIWLRQAEQPTSKRRAMAVCLYALAVGSKETAVPLVVIFPALWYFFRRRSIRQSLVASMPFIAVGAGYVALRTLVLSSEPWSAVVTRLNNTLILATSPAERTASALGYIAKYVAMLVWPHPLSFDYTFNAIPLQTFSDIEPWFGVVICAAVAGSILYGYRRRTLAGFATLWMAAALVLVSNLFFLVSTNFGERRSIFHRRWRAT